MDYHRLQTQNAKSTYIGEKATIKNNAFYMQILVRQQGRLSKGSEALKIYDFCLYQKEAGGFWWRPVK